MYGFFCLNFLQKEQLVQASPQKVEKKILVNGTLIDEKIEIVQSESPLEETETVSVTPTAATTPTKETREPEKKPTVDTKISTDDIKDAELLADSFVVTPDYIQQSM